MHRATTMMHQICRPRGCPLGCSSALLPHVNISSLTIPSLLNVNHHTSLFSRLDNWHQAKSRECGWQRYLYSALSTPYSALSTQHSVAFAACGTRSALHRFTMGTIRTHCIALSNRSPWAQSVCIAFAVCCTHSA